MPPVARMPLSLPEITLIVAIFAGWFIFASVQAVLAGFPIPRLGDRDALAIILLECLSFPVAAGVLWARGWRWKDFAVHPTWIASFFGILLFAATLLVNLILWAALSQTIAGADFLQRFAEAVTVSLPLAIVLSIINGAFEEFFLCRYLVEAFARYGAAMALGVSLLVRVVYHLYQGPLGAVLILAFGLVITLFYWRYRQVWPVMLAHMLMDFAAFA